MNSKLWIACTILATMAWTSCTQEDNTVYNMQIGDKQFLFTLNEEQYQNQQTRSGNAAASRVQTIDLGEDMQAEVSIDGEEDAYESSTTRATPLSNQRYVIYTLQNGTRVPDGVFRGTIKEVGGVKTFEPDAGTTSMLRFEGSNYTFVCYNSDAVTDDGTHLSFGTGKDAIVGTAELSNTTSAKHKLSFNMKHQTARVRVKLTAYSEAFSNVDAELISANAQPQTQQITNLTTFASTTTSTGVIAQQSNVEQTSTKFATKFPKAHEFYTDYVYFNPGVQANDLSLKFKSGIICGKDMTGKVIKLPASLGTLARNQSYTITVKLKTLNYLFEDSSVGVPVDKGTRTPVAFVVKEKTDTEEGMAIALKDINNISLATVYGAINGADELYQNNIMDDINGFKWTYDNIKVEWENFYIKANEKEKFPAFWAAAHYQDSLSVQTSGTMGKWYLPAAGEWLPVFVLLGKRGTDQYKYILDEATLKKIFEDPLVGGRTIYNKTYWTSTVLYNITIIGFIDCTAINNPHVFRADYFWSDIKKSVRPFVKF